MKQIPSFLVEEALRRIAAVKRQYPGCEDALAFNFGGAATTTHVFKTSGVPAANGEFGVGVDRADTDYGIFSRALTADGVSALYHRYPKVRGNTWTIAETTNNIDLGIAYTNLYDVLKLNFAVTDAAKTITLTEAATAWAGRRILMIIYKAATAGSRAVTLGTLAAESTLVPVGGGALAASSTLIAGTTSAAVRAVMLVGDGTNIGIFAA
jgi:hypothetical protein